MTKKMLPMMTVFLFIPMLSYWMAPVTGEFGFQTTASTYRMHLVNQDLGTKVIKKAREYRGWPSVLPKRLWNEASLLFGSISTWLGVPNFSKSCALHYFIRSIFAPMFLLLGVLILAIWFLVLWIQPLAALGVFERLTPNVVYRVPVDLPLVALSFDDGPHPAFTPQVLDILQRHEAKATFFLIGERALLYPELVARIKAAGHQVGNHYYKNGPIFGHSDAEFLLYLEQTEKVIGLTEEPKLFRAPGGVAWPRQLRLARAQGYTYALGSAYPNDPWHPPVWYITWLVEKNLAPGTIIILHDGISDPTRSIQALPQILDAGRQRGIRFVSIGELLGAKIKGRRP